MPDRPSWHEFPEPDHSAEAREHRAAVGAGVACFEEVFFLVVPPPHRRVPSCGAAGDGGRHARSADVAVCCRGRGPKGGPRGPYRRQRGKNQKKNRPPIDRRRAPRVKWPEESPSRRMPEQTRSSGFVSKEGGTK